MTEKNQSLEAISVKLAPVEMRLNVDAEFVDFVKKRILKQEVSNGKVIYAILLSHKIPFVVRACNPEKAVIGKNTSLEILNFDTRSDMRLHETSINIFMTDEQVKKKLSDYITKEIMTEINAVQIWKEFKKFQSDKLPEGSKVTPFQAAKGDKSQ
jgi:hypothetical protein